MPELFGKMANLEPLFRNTPSHVMLLGDSKSTAFATERWPKAMFYHWDINWRGRVIPAIDGDTNLYTSGWGFSTTNLNLGSTRIAPGATLGDGETTMPAFPRYAHEAWFTADRTTAFAYYDVVVNDLANCLRGSWLIDDKVKQTVMCVVGSGNVLTRFCVQQTRASDYGSQGEIVKMQHTYTGASGWGDSSVTLRVDLRHDLDNETNKGVWIVGNMVENQTGQGVLFNNLGYSSLAAMAHYPATWKANGTGWTDAQRVAYYDATEWPDLYLIDLGTNGSQDEIETLIEYLHYFHGVYDNGKPIRFGLIVTPDASTSTATWDSLEAIQEDIVDRRDDCALINLRRWMLQEEGAYSTWQATYLADGIHQNAAGTALFGKAMWRLIQQGLAADSVNTTQPPSQIESDVDAAARMLNVPHQKFAAKFPRP